ncbi:hypothetical protein AB1K54_00155 [Microbacterium sp. BWT-B31]|uniref:hypothetical protein n=1 Tax=Microbacterium sp. BWT-B31 TaxID=3232072 RepID=UPI003528EDED
MTDIDVFAAAPPAIPAAGERLPEFSRETSFDTWNRYAAVNDEFLGIHMDDEEGRAAGMSGAFGMGNMQIAYMHNLLRDWLDGHGRIVKVSAQFRRPNVKGRITVAATVVATRVQGDETFIDLDITSRHENGDILTPATATIAIGTVRETVDLGPG